MENVHITRPPEKQSPQTDRLTRLTKTEVKTFARCQYWWFGSNHKCTVATSTVAHSTDVSEGQITPENGVRD